MTNRTTQGPDPEALARVARRSLEWVEPHMLLGLGTGRAAEAFIVALGAAAREGLAVRGVATSIRSERLAREVGIEVLSIDEAVVAGDGDAGPKLDIAFDGADEVAPDLSLTKGLGGALLRERVVAYEARRFVILVTPEKLVSALGSRTPIPIEVVPFAQRTAARHLEALGGKAALRQVDGRPFLTDNQNVILDVDFGPIEGGELRSRDRAIRAVPGVVDTGFFLDMADVVLVGGPDEVVELTRS
jgi:ribose 5-phosphate isomerase A